MLQNDTLRSPPFHFDADPDPASHFDADPDPAFQFDADPDPAVQNDHDLYHWQENKKRAFSAEKRKYILSMPFVESEIVLVKNVSRYYSLPRVVSCHTIGFLTCYLECRIQSAM
jgi:hypothetical protein